MIKDTELRLSFWRDGSTKAERLAAGALRLSGYQEIDPQSPLGGPDGKKDILCQKGGLIWVGAVFFSNAPVKFTAIKKKFVSDLTGMPLKPDGFVFITNQSLTPTQRDVLSHIAKSQNKECDILHLQQLQNLLDSPTGYGLRIQYLGIGMTIEEQLSWAVDSDSQTAKALAAHTIELMAFRSQLQRMSDSQSKILRTMKAFEIKSLGVSTPDMISVSSFSKADSFSVISSSLTPALTRISHRGGCIGASIQVKRIL